MTGPHTKSAVKVPAAQGSTVLVSGDAALLADLSDAAAGLEVRLMAYADPSELLSAPPTGRILLAVIDPRIRFERES